MANFEKLRVPVSTPNYIWQVDLGSLSEEFQGPVGVIADVEGTLVEWGQTTIDPRLAEWVAEGFDSGRLVVMGLATNRNRGGAAMCERVSEQLSAVLPAERILSERPSTRDRRKPSGYLAFRIMHESIAGLKTHPAGFVIVGDKPSDMFEADAANRRADERFPYATPRINFGFMVERLGSADHPLDKMRFFGRTSIRERATAFRVQATVERPGHPHVSF